MQFRSMFFLKNGIDLACPRKRELSKLLKEAEEAELDEFSLGFRGDGLGFRV